MKPVVLDIDGTICENGHRIDWSNPGSVGRLCRPIPLAQARIASMYARGWEPFFLSARNDDCLGVTMKQLREWLPDGLADAADVWLWEMRFSDYGTPEAFHLAVGIWKASQLDGIAELFGETGTFVGDSESDRKAAMLAGWRFMHAEDWRNGQPFALDGEPMPRSVLAPRKREGAAA